MKRRRIFLMQEILEVREGNSVNSSGKHKNFVERLLSQIFSKTLAINFEIVAIFPLKMLW